MGNLVYNWERWLVWKLSWKRWLFWRKKIQTTPLNSGDTSQKEERTTYDHTNQTTTETFELNWLIDKISKEQEDLLKISGWRKVRNTSITQERLVSHHTHPYSPKHTRDSCLQTNKEGKFEIWEWIHFREKIIAKVTMWSRIELSLQKSTLSWAFHMV